MDRFDDLLQSSLASLERGVPLEKVLADLPEEASSLVPSITLAAISRNLDHPQMRLSVAQAQRRKVMDAAQAKSARFRLPHWGLVLAEGLVLFLVVAAVGLAISTLFTNPGMAQSAQLADINGMVEIAPSVTSTEWHFLTGNERVQQGAHIRTYADSSVLLTFSDGSSTLIGADADLLLTKVNVGKGNSLQVHLTQSAGTTSHDVIPLSGNGSFFLVDTPAGQASVHGTSFNVAVGSNGDTRFTVTRGEVQVKNDFDGVLLASGQATSVTPGEAPQEPAYQFKLEGPISAISGSIWTVQGVPITITDQADVLGSYQVGNVVYIQGRIMSSGEWQGDRVVPGLDQSPRFHLTGVIETMPGIPGTWLISGHPIQVTTETELSKGIKVGGPVEVTFVILPNNGGWLATAIDSLTEENQPTPRGKKTPTSTPTATDTLTPVVPSETSSPTATMTGTLPTPTTTLTLTPTSTVVPKNDSSRCDNRDQQQPEALRLVQRYGSSYDVIIAWFCKGFGFGEIDLAYGLSQTTGHPVSEIFSMRSSGMAWGQIKQQLSSQVTPRAGNDKSQGPGKTPVPKK